MMVPVGLCGELQRSGNGTKCMLELGDLPMLLHAGDPQEPSLLMVKTWDWALT